MISIVKSPFILVLIAVILLALGLAFNSLPAASAQPNMQLTSSKSVKLPWPKYGQSALGAAGYGVLAAHGSQKAVPIASIAKLVTALSILQQKPLGAEDEGPSITITKADQAIYDSYYVRDGSLVPIEIGEKIPERQALEAMMLPSANNMADTTAIWAFGSLDNYVVFANQYVKKLGMRDTYISDASGFSPQTISSAHDLVLLGQAVMENPVLASIVGETKATIPVAGEIWNLNWMLGRDGVIGIKTGNTDQAGGCYVFAAKRPVNGNTVTFVGAIMSAPTIHRAILDSGPLIRASGSGFITQTVLRQGQILGYYHTDWGKSAPVVAANDASMLVWQGSTLEPKLKLKDVRLPAAADKQVGTVTVSSGQGIVTVPAILGQPLKAPSYAWRLMN